MSDEGAAPAAERGHVVEGFVNGLYDESPIWPDDIPRERLLALWMARHDSLEPTGDAEGSSQDMDA
jgi:hypothetical protein